jgi:prolipoprotein diacylglyceryl transferase
LFVVLSSIPSPGFKQLDLGPFHLRMYGLMIALGVLAAVNICRRRYAARGGDPNDVSAIGMWAIPAGVIGARLYHVITDWKRYDGHWIESLYIWNGGLGIPGGIIGGVLAGIIVARRRRLSVPDLLDCVAPAFPLAQAIGRLGNWFNQELFGRPTKLPWGLRIDPVNRPERFAGATTFHPTFLYEALWNLVLVAVLLWIDKRHRLRPGALFWCYILGYSLGRLWVEDLRSDPASLLLGVRVNIWTSGAGILIGGLMLLRLQRRRAAPGPAEEVASSPEATETSSSDTPQGQP